MTTAPAAVSSPSRTALQEMQLRIAHTNWQWKMWKQLYLEDPAAPGEWESRADLLTRSGNGFFFMLRSLLFEGVILGICRLTDSAGGPSSMPSRKNLSLALMYAQEKPRLSPSQCAGIDRQLAMLKKSAGKLRDFRNHDIAHLDFNTAMQRSNLPSIPYADVEASLEAIVTVLTVLCEDLLGHGFLYGAPMGSGSASELLSTLRDAQLYQEEQIARHRSGS